MSKDRRRNDLQGDGEEDKSVGKWSQWGADGSARSGGRTMDLRRRRPLC